MTDYKRAFRIACELLNGSVLYGVDTDKIYEIMMDEDGIVTNNSYEKYILTHLDELDQGQYVGEGLDQMSQELKEIILKKCKEQERMGYDVLTDSDIMDILEESQQKGIDATRKDLERLGLD